MRCKTLFALSFTPGSYYRLKELLGFIFHLPKKRFFFPQPKPEPDP